MNYATRFTNVCASQFTGICAISNAQKKHVLTHFLQHAKLLTLQRTEHVVEGRKYFPLVLISLECQRKTLSVYYM